MRDEGYDVIGDVHGCGRVLVTLLHALGYRDDDGVFRHPRRRVVFVGDLIDRGPEQVLAVDIARTMVDAGSASIVMGNHEFNAIAYATPDPDPRRAGGYLRTHSEKNRRQHAAFARQVRFGSSLHRWMIDWFATMPLSLDLDGLRVVHACWDAAGIATATELFGDGPLTADAVARASLEHSPEWQTIETLLKGPEIPVAPPYLDKEDHQRDHARFRWWDPEATTLRRGAYIPPNTTTIDGEPYPPLPDEPIEPPVRPYPGDVPLIYGHYWYRGRPTRSSPATACVDYSAAKGGHLVAYRWSGETELSDDNFVGIPADPH